MVHLTVVRCSDRLGDDSLNSVLNARLNDKTRCSDDAPSVEELVKQWCSRNQFFTITLLSTTDVCIHMSGAGSRCRGAVGSSYVKRFLYLIDNQNA